MGRRLQMSLPHGCIVLLALVFSLLLQPARARAADEQVIRVGCISGIGKAFSLTISSKKPFRITDPSRGEPIASLDAGHVVLSLDKGKIGIALDDSAAGSFKGPIRLIPKETGSVFEVVTLQPAVTKARTGKYRGILEIRGGSVFSVVNELPLEDYVRGVIPMEVPKSFHPEAQKALTVAIRTYALTSLGRHKSGGYDVCDTTDCQGFAGASKDAPWIDGLVDQTRGRIIVYKGEPIHAVYSTNCGGMTQNNEDAGFGDKPWAYLRAVVDAPSGACGSVGVWGCGGAGDAGIALDARVASAPIPNPKSEIRNPQCDDYCAKCPFHAWSKRYTAAELGRVFSRVSSARIGKLQSLEFAEYDCSGRVRTVVAKGDRGDYRTSGNKFRSLLGASTIKSTRMTLSVAADGAFVIDGKGYGHGVGLCAFGADGLARSDAKITCVDILKHYYTGVEIAPISECGMRIAD